MRPLSFCALSYTPRLPINAEKKRGKGFGEKEKPPEERSRGPRRQAGMNAFALMASYHGIFSMSSP